MRCAIAIEAYSECLGSALSLASLKRWESSSLTRLALGEWLYLEDTKELMTQKRGQMNSKIGIDSQPGRAADISICPRYMKHRAKKEGIMRCVKRFVPRGPTSMVSLCAYHHPYRLYCSTNM